MQDVRSPKERSYARWRQRKGKGKTNELVSLAFCSRPDGERRGRRGE
jgi:hypothetical protein